MTNYSEIITNKNTIDKATHVFAPKKPKEMMSYRMVFDTINVEVMNAILLMILSLYEAVEAAQQPITTIRESPITTTTVKSIIIVISQKTNPALAIWKQRYQVPLTI